jgi:hypothetical protein
MSIDLAALTTSITEAAAGAAKGHAQDLRTYLHARAILLASSAAQIAADRLAGEITDDDVRFAFEQIKKSEQTALRAAQVTAKAAAQDAINAALGVVSTAIGVALL